LNGLIIIVSAPVFSRVKFGIMAGAETTRVPTYQYGNGDAAIDALKDASWGYHAGIFLRFNLGAVYGYQAGEGIDLGRLTLDIRYAGSLGEKFGDSITIEGPTFKLDYRQSCLLLSAGLMF
jgi:hypothetical protein